MRSDERPEEGTGSKVERVRPSEILKGVNSAEQSGAEERRGREPRRSQTDGREPSRAAREEAPQEDLSTPHAEEEFERATESALDRRPREERGRRRNGEQEHPQAGAGEDGGQRQGQGNAEQERQRNAGGQETGRHRNGEQAHPRTEEEDAAEIGGDSLSQATEGEEEGSKAKGMHAPRVVSKEEREEHERTHIPYRSWCRACVKGRKRKKPHMKKSREEKEEDRATRVPRISMDYHFMSKSDEEAKKHPLFTMINKKTGDKYIRAV